MRIAGADGRVAPVPDALAAPDAATTTSPGVETIRGMAGTAVMVGGQLERWRALGCGVAVVFVRADDGQEGVREHGQGDPAGPGG